MIGTMGFCILLSVLAIAIGTGYGAKKEYFTAAVFEMIVIPDFKSKTTEEILQTNLNLYVKATEEAAKREADIIVFPEYGLVPYRERSQMADYMEQVPDPKKNAVNPCEEQTLFEDRPILSTLSCMAKNHGLYVVANLVSTQPCDEESKTCDASNVDGCDASCPVDGRFLYNSVVAFDRKGTLIARYYKNHLFYFEKHNTPTNPIYSTFETEFGTFGIISCFDSVFQHPVNLVKKYNIDTLLYPTHWYDDILPLNAIEWQQSWALANGVNFLAADMHRPELGTLGSGIYSKTYGALSYSYNPDGKPKLVVARVPLNTDEVPDIPNGETDVIIITEDDVYEEKDIGQNFPNQCYNPLVGPAQGNATEYRCFKSQVDKYTLKKLESGKHEVKACHKDFCCTVKYSAQDMNEEYYLAAFRGLNDVRDFYKWHEESCMLVRCDPFGGKPCAVFPSQAETVFDYVEMKATFTAEQIYPTVSKAYYRLAPKYEWKVKKSDKNTILTYKSKSDEPLLKVALLGRVYSKDPPFAPFNKF